MQIALTRLLVVAAFAASACKPRVEATSATASLLPANAPSRYLVLETSVDASGVFHGSPGNPAWVPTIKSQIATLTLGVEGRVERVRDEAHLLALLANEAKTIPADGSLVLALGAHGGPTGLEYEPGRTTSLSTVLVAMTDARLEAKLPPMQRLVLLVAACYAGSQSDAFDLTGPLEASGPEDPQASPAPLVDDEGERIVESLASQVETFAASHAAVSPGFALAGQLSGDAALFQEAIALYITSENTVAYLGDFRTAFSRTMEDLPYDVSVDEWATALRDSHKSVIAGATAAAKSSAKPRAKSEPMLIRYHPDAKAASIREGFLMPDALVASLRAKGAVELRLPGFAVASKMLVGARSYTVPAKLISGVYRPLTPPRPPVTPRSVTVDQVIDAHKEQWAALVASSPDVLFHVQVYRDAAGLESHRVRFVSRP
jgi:hypothetical protein